MMGRKKRIRKGIIDDLKRITHQSNMVETVLWHGHVWLPEEQLTVVYFIDDMTADGSIWMNSEVYRAKHIYY